jgi:hypothetical protein
MAEGASRIQARSCAVELEQAKMAEAWPRERSKAGVCCVFSCGIGREPAATATLAQ